MPIEAAQGLNEEEVKGFAEMERGSLALMDKLRGEIEKNRVGTIIGIDKSGRLPALLVHLVIKNIYAKHGYEMPKIYFFRGKLNYSDGSLPMLSQAIKQAKIRKDRGILIVDDIYNTGESIEPFMDTFNEMGHETILAVLNVSGTPESMQGKYPRSYYGLAGDEMEDWYFYNQSLTGVGYLEDDGGVHAVPWRFVDPDLKWSEKDKTSLGRKLLKEAVDRVTAGYESRKT